MMKNMKKINTNKYFTWRKKRLDTVFSILFYPALCPGYNVSYFNQNNSVYIPAIQCPGYNVSLFNQNNSVYIPAIIQCPGYNVSFLTKIIQFASCGMENDIYSEVIIINFTMNMTYSILFNKLISKLLEKLFYS